MMQEGVCNDTAVKKLERTAVAVPLLGWCDAALRNGYSQAFIVFADAVVRLVVVVFFSILS